MFLAHFGVGFGAKQAAPALSLGTLFLAAQLADLIWPTLLLVGVEEVRIAPGATAVTPLDFVRYPFSHSLLALGIWGLLLGVLLRVVRRSSVTAAATAGAVVVSHWVLDLLVHRPDLPVTLASAPKLGLGLWNSPPATLVLEGVLFAGGLWLYTRTTRAADAIGRFALWGLAVFLVVVYAANLAGPPPPSTAAIAWTAQALWLVVLWGYWVDRHREARAA